MAAAEEAVDAAGIGGVDEVPELIRTAELAIARAVDLSSRSMDAAEAAGAAGLAEAEAASVAASASASAAVGPTDDMPEVIAKTAIIAGGGETSVSFDPSTLNKEGKYIFLCTFPGHYAIMKGNVVLM